MNFVNKKGCRILIWLKYIELKQAVKRDLKCLQEWILYLNLLGRNFQDHNLRP